MFILQQCSWGKLLCQSDLFLQPETLLRLSVFSTLCKVYQLLTVNSMSTVNIHASQTQQLNIDFSSGISDSRVVFFYQKQVWFNFSNRLGCCNKLMNSFVSFRITHYSFRILLVYHFVMLLHEIPYVNYEIFQWDDVLYYHLVFPVITCFNEKKYHLARLRQRKSFRQHFLIYLRF